MNEGEELIRRLEQAAKDGAKSSGRRGLLAGIIAVAVIAVILLCGVFYIKQSLDNRWDALEDDFHAQFDTDEGANEHDLVLDNDLIFGYTAADFEDAILSDPKMLKKLEVYEAEVSDAVTLTDTGLANLAIFSKTQVITYYGTAIYTVDLSHLSKNNILFDETHKTVTLRIPHTERSEINIPSNRMVFGDMDRGWLAFGEISLTPEQAAGVETEAREKMELKLDEMKARDEADRFARLSVWEIYQPVISEVSPEYKLEVDFE